MEENMFEFEIVDKNDFKEGTVQYIKEDYSFDYKPLRNTDIGIEIAYLIIGIDSVTMLARYVWGYSPMDSWQGARLIKPKSVKKSLKLLGEYEGGYTWRLDKDGTWDSYFDEITGWYCIGDTYVSESDLCVEFAENTLAVLCGKKLKSIWLHPEFI